MSESAHKFTKKRAIKLSRKQCIQILEYVVFCYDRLKRDNEENRVYYSISYCRKHTGFKFEDWLKMKFVDDYLQKFKSDFQKYQIKEIQFQYETWKPYIDQVGKERRDQIDIFISNLGLQKYWGNVVKEDLYFAIECKRLKNTSKNASYITEIQKFVERQHKRFRFPFEGMIGFVEKSSISIDAIIDDINERLKTHSTIRTNKELTPFPICKDFKYCRLSKHDRILPEVISIEVYHLFFDYAKLIVE